MAVSIVIVTYNSAECLPACLESLKGTEAEIVVVDNASEDGSAELARGLGVRVIANARNCGFAAAANQGVRAAGPNSEFILFLNPDTVLLEGFSELPGALDRNPQAAAAAGLLVDDAGRPQRGFALRRLPTFTALAFEALLVNRLWPGNPVNRHYRCLDADLARLQEAEQPAGACLLVRRTALEAVGGLDERFYPLWFEDVDLCKRLLARGFRILFVPTSRWRHRGAHSLALIPFAEKHVFWYRNVLYFVRKHMGRRAALAMRGCVCLGAVARWLAAFLGQNGQFTWRACWAVLKVALAKAPDPRPPCAT
jgi:N-acetylglucosaminyl-diphospho-decaprenol L-rhamnosyltransferase